MSKGKIEKEDKAGFDLVKDLMFKKWDDFKGINSLNIYLEQGRTISGFLWDTFYATGIKIGDGVGMSGDVLWYKLGHDEHITTAFKAIWNQYIKARGV